MMGGGVGMPPTPPDSGTAWADTGKAGQGG